MAHQSGKGNQAGLLYWTFPGLVATPGIEDGLRLYRSRVDNLWYVKDSNGDSAIFHPFDLLENYIGSTSDGAQHELFVGGNIGQRIEIENNTSSFIQLFTMARRTGGVAPGSFGATGVTSPQFVAKNINGIVTIDPPAAEQPLQFGDPETLGWTLEVQISGQELVVLVRGQAGVNINWKINSIEIIRLQG